MIDLGCGTGNMAPFLMQNFPSANLICYDSSAEMLKKAKDIHNKNSSLDTNKIKYVCDDFENFQTRISSPVDLIFSNSALHW
eukprot:Pgem_evm1s16961